MLEDLTLLALRVLVGSLFLMHGLAKYKPGSNFVPWVASMLPLPQKLGEIVGVGVRSWEVLAGFAIAVGFGAWIPEALLIVVMAGAIATVHRKWSPDITEGGWEYCAVLIGVLLVLASAGNGPYALDTLLP